LDPIEPIWLSDLNLFIEELETNFRTYSPVGEAEAELKGLCMHESHQAMKYFIKFQQLAAHVQWGEAALCRQAYNGLAKCIKDDMVHHEKPNTLSGLRKLIQVIDAQYWDDAVKYPQTRASGTSGNKTEQKSDSSKSDNKSGKGSSQSKQKNNHSGSTQSKGSTSEQKKSTTPDLSSKLRKDGKLTPRRDSAS